MPEFAFPHSRSLRAKFSCKESQGDELDEVDEEVTSSAVFCAASCLRHLAAHLLKAFAFAESLSSRDLLGAGILLVLCLLRHTLAASWTRTREREFCLRTAYAHVRVHSVEKNIGPNDPTCY